MNVLVNKVYATMVKKIDKFEAKDFFGFQVGVAF